MSEKETKWVLRPGVLLMLGLLLYVGTYLLARGSGRIVRIEGRSSTVGTVVVAPESDWADIEGQLSSGAGPSVVFASFQPMPRILNAVFWPLRKLEALIRNLASPRRAVITRVPDPGRILRMDSPPQTFAAICAHSHSPKFPTRITHPPSGPTSSS